MTTRNTTMVSDEVGRCALILRHVRREDLTHEDTLALRELLKVAVRLVTQGVEDA